jgi:uncharacterized lipoprotein YajG
MPFASHALKPQKKENMKTFIGLGLLAVTLLVTGCACDKRHYDETSTVTTESRYSK